MKDPVNISYSDFLGSLNLDECSIADDTLEEECDGVFILYSNELNAKEKQVRIQKVINNDNCVESINANTLMTKFCEEVFAKTTKGIYIRDIAQVPDGHEFLLDNVQSYINESENTCRPGINSPMLYTGLRGSYTALHIEDQNLCSLNVLLEGGEKVWLVVERSMRAKLTANFAEHMIDNPNSSDIVCPQAIEHKIYSVSPQLLKQWEIPYKIVIQKPGDLFFIRSGTYHTVVNMGRNTAEAVNVGSDLWNCNYDSPVCQCIDNKRKYVPHNRAIVYTIKKQATLHICKYNACNKAFKTLTKLKNHEKVQHNKKDTYTCDACLATFTYKSNLIRHLKMHSQVNEKKCTECGKKVKNLQAHIASVHSCERPTCEICGKQIKKCNYEKHVANCQICCPHCQKVFTGAKYLKRHVHFIHKK